MNFISDNEEILKVEHIDFKFALINPKNLIGIDEFNQEFFDKIDKIENDILNGVEFDSIISEFNLSFKSIKDYKFTEASDDIEKKIFEKEKIFIF